MLRQSCEDFPPPLQLGGDLTSSPPIFCSDFLAKLSRLTAIWHIMNVATHPDKVSQPGTSLEHFPTAQIGNGWTELRRVLSQWATKHPNSRLPFKALLQDWLPLRGHFIFTKASELLTNRLAWDFACTEQRAGALDKEHPCTHFIALCLYGHCLLDYTNNTDRDREFSIPPPTDPPSTLRSCLDWPASVNSGISRL